ncbi:hypothetical protein ACLB2K_073754 [Fragaria x ananassa]
MRELSPDESDILPSLWLSCMNLPPQRPDQRRTSAPALKCGRPSVRHRTTPARTCLHLSRLQQRPRPLSLTGESAEFQFSGQKNGIRQTRRRWKVVGDAVGVRWGRGAPSPVSYSGERRDVRILRAMQTSALERLRVYIYTHRKTIESTHAHGAPLATVRCLRRRASPQKAQVESPTTFPSRDAARVRLNGGALSSELDGGERRDPLLNRPSAAISDATSAIKIDSKYAKGYKSRGAAYSMLAKWEEAAQDLQSASELDFDEETSACLT